MPSGIGTRHRPHQRGSRPGGRLMLRLGIVGLGVISQFYLAALQRSPHARLAAVCDVREQALLPWRALVPCHTDHRAMLATDQLDGVIVTTPNDTHSVVC